MGSGTIIIIGMTTLTATSAIVQGILGSAGKVTESQYMDMATKSLLAVTALACLAKLIQQIQALGW